MTKKPYRHDLFFMVIPKTACLQVWKSPSAFCGHGVENVGLSQVVFKNYSSFLDRSRWYLSKYTGN